MAEQDRVKIYNLGESYGGGSGGAFPSGRYRIEEASFVMFDFNGKAKAPSACLCCNMQPLDEDGNEAGDVKVQYWPIGDDVKPVDKGKAIILTGTRDKIWNMSPFFQFMSHLGKAGVDLDAVEDENDISLIAGKVGDFSKVLALGNQPENVGQVVDGKKVYPKETIVMTKLYEEAKKGKGKAAAGKVDKATEKKGGKAAKADEQTDEELMVEYLSEKILTEKNEGGVDKLTAIMGINKYVQTEKGLSVERAKAVRELINDNDNLATVLAAAGWAMEGKKIKKEE